MTTLLIDIGNTRLKWGLDSDEGFVFGGVCNSQPDAIESLFTEQWGGLRPDGLLMSCVANKAIEQDIFQQAKSTWNIPAQSLLTPKQGCGISNAYERPETLGSDRWAAMVAAYQQVKGPVCVVSCGTALTLDAIDGTGRHLGGLILPGLGLMQDCLQKGTKMHFISGLAVPGPEGLGRSTEECIQQGTTIAISSLVDNMLESLKIEQIGMSLILTGGDAGLLQARLCHESSLEPHLVLQGLAIIHRGQRMDKPK